MGYSTLKALGLASAIVAASNIVAACKAVSRQPVAIKKSSTSSTSSSTAVDTSLNQYSTLSSTSSYTSVNTSSSSLTDTISIECANATSSQLSVTMNMRSVWPFIVRPLTPNGAGRITNISPSMQLRGMFFDGDTVVFTPTSQFELNGSLTVTAQDSSGRSITKTFNWSPQQMTNYPLGTNGGYNNPFGY